MTSPYAVHPVKVTVEHGQLYIDCEHNTTSAPLAEWGDTLTEAQSHARHGDGEDRYCPNCQDPRPSVVSINGDRPEYLMTAEWMRSMSTDGTLLQAVGLVERHMEAR